MDKEIFVRKVFELFKQQYGDNVKASFEIEHNKLILSIEENHILRHHIYPKSRMYKVGDRFRIKHLGKVETSTIEEITYTEKINCIGTINSIYETPEQIQYELFVDRIGSLFVTEAYLNGLERTR